ncbi:MAG: hypothetical protein WAM18_12290, partial [Halobacillus sp.]|uniref:hypothetical protein n=1 Tax=Halobacillus sp. TaxID=56800 RepID=UPI003BB19F27
GFPREGVSLRKLSARDVRLKPPRPVATSNDPASCRAGKRIVSRQTWEESTWKFYRYSLKEMDEFFT